MLDLNELEQLIAFADMGTLSLFVRGKTKSRWVIRA